MKLYKFWAPAEATIDSWTVRTYGGSNESLEDAKLRAHELSQRVVGQMAQNNAAPEKYPYAERPLREEIVEEIHHGDTLAAAITRNAYGSLVLNTSRVMFIDVDYPEKKPPGVAELGGMVKKLWGRFSGKPEEPPPPSPDDVLLERFEQVTRSQPGLGIRVYRTAAGYRLLATNQSFDPTADEVRQLLSAFGSDKLYVRLCKTQQCFRARLSAKYWRCGAEKPPARYPWIEADGEARYRNWEQAYHLLANQYATCALVGNFGEMQIDAEVAPILETHDRLTFNDGAPLA